jgi:hypothetical protein
VLWRLLSDPGELSACADGVLDEAEQHLLLWDPPPRSPGSARWSGADAVLLDELRDVLRRTPSLGHVILDEAQDLSQMQLRAVGRRCSTGSVTVLGDLAQGTTPWATRSWTQTLGQLGHPEAVIEELSQGFRVPSSVIDFAARLLPHIATGLTPPTSVREDPGRLELTAVPAVRLWSETVAATRRALAAEGSVGLIVPDADVRRAANALAHAGIPHDVLGDDGLSDGTGTDLLAEQLADHLAGDDVDQAVRVWVVPATTAKGLEYDHVVVVEPTAMAGAEPDERTGLRRLYVVLTRAVTGLEVVHARPLPGPLLETRSTTT